jgi:hypothetical protein
MQIVFFFFAITSPFGLQCRRRVLANPMHHRNDPDYRDKSNQKSQLAGERPIFRSGRITI